MTERSCKNCDYASVIGCRGINSVCGGCDDASGWVPLSDQARAFRANRLLEALAMYLETTPSFLKECVGDLWEAQEYHLLKQQIQRLPTAVLVEMLASHHVGCIYRDYKLSAYAENALRDAGVYVCTGSVSFCTAEDLKREAQWLLDGSKRSNFSVTRAVFS